MGVREPGHPGGAAGLPVAGRAVRTGPLCWGQVWSWHQQQLPERHRSLALILARVVELAEGAGPADVYAAVRLAVERHESLRSTFALDSGGVPWQTVWPADVGAYQTGEFDREADALAWLYRHMDIAEGWPLRIALVHGARGGLRLGLATHHIATDLQGYDLLCEELRSSVHAHAAGRTPALPPPGCQPLDVAAFETSPAGAAVNQRAIAHWLRHDAELGEVLAAMRARFDRPSDVLNVARAVARGGRPAHGGRANPTTVAVAAIACVLAGQFGRDGVPMSMMVSNRHLPGARNSVACLAQMGLLSVPIPDTGSLARAAPATWTAMLTTMRRAHYDGDELSERMTSFERGLQMNVTQPSVNIVRTGPTVPGLRLVPRARTATGGRFDTWAGQVGQYAAGLHFHVQADESQVLVELRAGTHLRSLDECEETVADVMDLILGPLR